MNVFPLDPVRHAADYDGSGQLRPLHGVGLSALLAPAVGAGRPDGRAARDGPDRGAPRRPALPPASRPAASGAATESLPGSAVVGCSPLLVFASQIYPEFPAALLIVVALRVMVRHASSPAALALGATAGAALVWLHVRYLPLAMGVFAGLGPRRRALLAGTAPSRRGIRATVADYAATALRNWRTRDRPGRRPGSRSGSAPSPRAFQCWYGTPDPTAPYRAFSTHERRGRRLEVPVRLRARATSSARSTDGSRSCPCTGSASPPSAACSAVRLACRGVPRRRRRLRADPGERSAERRLGPPGAVPDPLLAADRDPDRRRAPARPVCHASFSSRSSRSSLVFGVAAARDHYGPLSDRRRAPVSTASGAWRTYSRSRSPRTRRRRSCSTPASTRPRPESSRTEWSSPERVRTVPGSSCGARTARSRKARTERPSRWRSSGVTPDTHVATIEVAGAPPPGKVFADKVVTGAELKSRTLTAIPLDFSMPGGYLVETRVFYHGRGTLRAGPGEGSRLTLSPGAPVTRAGSSSGWRGFCGTVLFGWLFVRRYRRQVLDWLRRDDELIGQQRGAQPPDPVSHSLDSRCGEHRHRSGEVEDGDAVSGRLAASPPESCA